MGVGLRLCADRQETMRPLPRAEVVEMETRGGVPGSSPWHGGCNWFITAAEFICPDHMEPLLAPITSQEIPSMGF